MDYQIKWLGSMNLCLRLTHMIDRLFRVCYLGSINSSVSRRFSFPGAKSWSTTRNSAKRHLTKTNRKPVNRDRCCRFKLLCALKIMKNSKQAKSFYSLWDTKICKQNLFTPINCLDNAVCLHFTETHKIA